mmetsp:Transcript_12753/g.32091  ORF Transcript_12753/g.32091 Transcript_12753/m.32091 type:complete len:272 (-) Transcript_12753:600-1415(-)
MRQPKDNHVGLCGAALAQTRPAFGRGVLVASHPDHIAHNVAPDREAERTKEAKAKEVGMIACPYYIGDPGTVVVKSRNVAVKESRILCSGVLGGHCRHVDVFDRNLFSTDSFDHLFGLRMDGAGIRLPGLPKAPPHRGGEDDEGNVPRRHRPPCSRNDRDSPVHVGQEDARHREPAVEGGDHGVGAVVVAPCGQTPLEKGGKAPVPLQVASVLGALGHLGHLGRRVALLVLDAVLRAHREQLAHHLPPALARCEMQCCAPLGVGHVDLCSH